MYKYLRLSLTPRCNMRCRYCLPNGYVPVPGARFLSEAAVLRVVELLVREHGISKIRLTGGEPLIAANVLRVSRRIAAMPGVTDLAITTNALRLASMAEALADAGVHRVNVSLDTLDRERFRQLTGVDGLDQVLAGIARAVAVGLSPVKVNVVNLRGVNDRAEDVRQLLDWAAASDVELRFLEYMPIGGEYLMGPEAYVSGAEMRRLVEQVAGTLTYRGASSGGTAEMHTLEYAGHTMPIGFVNPVSNPFCVSCGRLRLTAEGRLVRCLRTQESIDLKPHLGDERALTAILGDYLRPKLVRPEFHAGLPMIGIGG